MKIDRAIKLETPRCILRHITEADIPHIFSATRYEGFNDGMAWNPPADISELHISYKNNVDAWEAGKSYTFSIDEKATNAFIGRITIRKQNEPNIWTIGYWTHPEQQGNGYMSEVVPIVIRFGFIELGATEILAQCAVWNNPSKKVLIKSGMKFTTTVKEGLFKNGEWIEEEVFSIKQKEWQETVK